MVKWKNMERDQDSKSNGAEFVSSTSQTTSRSGNDCVHG
jgi:hypothetical protein